MRFAAVFLDFDQTLQDFESAYARAFEEAVLPVCEAAEGAVTPAELRSRALASWASIWDRFVAGALDERGLWAERSVAVLTAAAVPRDPVLEATVVSRYVEAMESGLRLFPDTLPALAALEAARPRPVLGVLTNGPGVTQRARLRRHGLERRFDVVLISGELHRAKPDAAFFAEACARAGVAAGDAVMVGDNPIADIAGARGAGLAAVWLDRAGLGWPAGVRPAPDIRAPDLTAAVAWILDPARGDRSGR